MPSEVYSRGGNMNTARLMGRPWGERVLCLCVCVCGLSVLFLYVVCVCGVWLVLYVIYVRWISAPLLSMMCTTLCLHWCVCLCLLLDLPTHITNAIQWLPSLGEYEPKERIDE